MLIGARLADGMRVVETWREHFSHGYDRDVAPRATISGGVAEWQLGETAAELFARADGALDSAKDAGRDRVIRASAAAGLRVGAPQRRAVSRPLGD
jgi:GGDEF domain-containing protein